MGRDNGMDIVVFCKTAPSVLNLVRFPECVLHYTRVTFNAIHTFMDCNLYVVYACLSCLASKWPGCAIITVRTGSHPANNNWCQKLKNTK